MFRWKPKAPSEAEFRGPLELVPGDRVLYYQQEFTLAGVVFLVSGKERRCQYHFLDADGLHAVIAFGAGPDPRITLEHALSEDDQPDVSADTFELDGTTFCLESEQEARAFSLGGIPPEKGEVASVRAFVDEDEMEMLVAEDWRGYVEIRRGESIHVNELVVKRQRDEDDWDIKPPPKIDLRSLNEARRTKEMEARAKASRAQADELAAARAKLAAFQDDAPQEEAEGVVALSEIVDVRHRFPDEELPESPGEPEPDEARPPEEPAPASAPPADDPFSSVFEEDEAAHPADPYQDYMESDEEGDEREPPRPVLDSEPLFPEIDAEKAPAVDAEREEFLSAGIFGDDEDDDLLG